ncbi:MAG: hypothetical protein FWF12_12160 [Betaproteobacteria bacterium]|nr:hypothetical protein [Betaproteobacteria bacterium]
MIIQILLKLSEKISKMERPIALKMLSEGKITVHRVRTEPLNIATLNITTNAPAVLVARKATMLTELESGIVDASDIIAAADGDWSNAILVLAENIEVQQNKFPSQTNNSVGDERFFQSVEKLAPFLLPLSRRTVELIRSAGVEGELVEHSQGRWINSPLNIFTLRVQPQRRNLQFTLYGNPSSYEHDGFLDQDRPGYSRGVAHRGVKTEDDAKKLAALVKQSYARKTKMVEA